MASFNRIYGEALYWGGAIANATGEGMVAGLIFQQIGAQLIASENVRDILNNLTRTTVFRPNPNFGRELAEQRQFQAAMAGPAAAALNEARASAPIHTGHYRDSLQLFAANGSFGLITTDIAGHLVEWGSANNPPYAPLRLGVRKAGLRFEENA